MEKPHIYLGAGGWRVRHVTYGRVSVSGPFYFLRSGAFMSAKLIWNHDLHYINERNRREQVHLPSTAP